MCLPYLVHLNQIQQFKRKAHYIITYNYIVFQFCMLCSAGYHMFGCHSERASKRWLAVDLAGILVGVIGCYLPAVHYAFYCLSVSKLYMLNLF